MDIKESYKIIKGMFFGKLYIEKEIPYHYTKRSEFEKTVKKILMDYEKLEMKERHLFELKVKYNIDDMERLALLSIPFAFIPQIFNNLLKDKVTTLAILYFVLYGVYGILIIRTINKLIYLKLIINTLEKYKNNELYIKIGK